MQVHRKSISQTVFSIAQMIMHGTVTIFFVPGKSFRPPGRFLSAADMIFPARQTSFFATDICFSVVEKTIGRVSSHEPGFFFCYSRCVPYGPTRSTYFC